MTTNHDKNGLVKKMMEFPHISTNEFSLNLAPNNGLSFHFVCSVAHKCGSLNLINYTTYNLYT